MDATGATDRGRCLRQPTSIVLDGRVIEVLDDEAWLAISGAFAGLWICWSSHTKPES